MSVTVYGSSDDLIEVEGDIREEFGAAAEDDGDHADYLALSNGVVLSVVYDNDGMWRIRPLVGVHLVTVIPALDPDDNYSDRAVVEGDISWVVHGTEWARRVS